MSTVINTEQEIIHTTQGSVPLASVFEDLKHQSNASSMPCGVEGDNERNDSSASANVKFKDTNVNIECVGEQYMETDAFVCNSVEDIKLDSCVTNKNSSSAGLLNLKSEIRENSLYDKCPEVNVSSQKTIDCELFAEKDVLNNNESNVEDGPSSNFVNDSHQKDLDFSALEQSMEVSYEKPESVDQSNQSENNVKSKAVSISELTMESKVEFVDNKFVSDALAEDGDEWQMEDYEEGYDDELEEGEVAQLEGESEPLEDGDHFEDVEGDDLEEHENEPSSVEDERDHIEEIDQLEEGETSQLERAEIDKLEDEIDQLEEAEVDEIEDELDQLEQGESDQLGDQRNLVGDGKGDHLGEGETIHLEGYQVEEDETDNLEKNGTNQLENLETDQLEKEKEHEIEQLEEHETDQLNKDKTDQLNKDETDQLNKDETDQLNKGETDCLKKDKSEQSSGHAGSSVNRTTNELAKGVTDKLEKEISEKTKEEILVKQPDKEDIFQEHMEIGNDLDERDSEIEQVTKEDDISSTVVQNKHSDDKAVESDDDADVDDILDKISKEDALGKSGMLAYSLDEGKNSQDVEMKGDISKSQEVIIEDSDDDDFDPISLLAVEHSTPDEPMDSEFSKKIGICNSDDSRPSSVSKFLETNIDQNVDSPSVSLLKSDESVDEESQDSVDLKETTSDIDKIVIKTLEDIITKTVCIVDNIPEHFFYSSHQRKKLGFIPEGSVEEVMDEIVSKVSVSSKKLAKEVAKANKSKESKSLEKEASNQNNLDNQKGFKNCTECGSNKGLKYQVLFHGRTCFLCSDNCFKIFRSKQNLAPPPPGLTRATETCSVCRVEIKNGQGYFPLDTDGKSVCSEECIRQYQQMHGAKQTCAQCKKDIEGRTKCLSWETMEFCNEDCLGKYQQYLGSYCACCKSPVQRLSLGKYCVRFGSDIRQFCSGKCLEEFKRGLKVCTFCQKDLTGCTDGFLAPVGTKGVFKDFCSQQCLSQYETVNSAAGSVPKTKKCSVCQKIGPIKAQVVFNKQEHTLCSDPCVAAFRYANKITNKICDTCHKFFKSESSPLQFEGASKRFCGKTCMNLFVLSHRKIVPCTWCKVKKYNFDMIERVDSNNHVQLFCSLNCLSLFRVSLNATSSRSVCCDHCHNNLPAQYHLTMSDASIRNFCTYQCVIQFQSQFTSVPTLTTVTPTIRNQTVPQAASTPQVVTPPQPVPVNKPVALSNATPVISSVISLAPGSLGPVRPTQATITNVNNISTAVNNLTGTSFIPQAAQVNFTPFVNKVQAVQATPVPTSQPQPATTVQVIREIVVKPPMPKITKNKMVLCKPSMQTKGVACKPHPCHKCTQTEEPEPPPPTYVPIPIPVPIFVPVPMHMYTRTVPFPTPFPIPIPVPIFLPTTKSTTEQIVQHINEIRERTPENPFEAELLMMAEMVAAQEEESDEKPKINHNSDPPMDNNDYDGLPSMSSADNSLGHDFAEFTEPMLDLETALIPPQYDPSNIIEEPASVVSSLGDESSSDVLTPREQRMRQRNSASTKRRNSSGGRAIRGGRGRKKARLTESLQCSEDSSEPYVSGNETSFSEPIQRITTAVGDGQSPDANLCLKFMFGVNAWKHWVVHKNNQLEKGSQSRKLKLFKTDLLQLTADELNYSLCLFVKEVRKPNGEVYAPDSIYYLCLGIQMYIFENGRVDNIFTDSYYEKFTECLNEVVQKQEMAVMRDGRYVSRIEEEILWESKQLGAHSPHVLLNTLMYFNTKHFGLRNVNDHALLSFSHIIKHYKKDLTPEHGSTNKVLASTPGKLAVLRYYPPSKDTKRNRKEEVVYEQVENLHNVLRCPVKLYEFYLSKCPDSIRTRSDVFYLYPERSCVPDSPVWYSMQPLGRDTLSKMIHRIRMVREINRPNLVD